MANNVVEIEIKINADTKELTLTGDELEKLKAKAAEAAQGADLFNSSLKGIAISAAGIVGVSAIFEEIGGGIKKAVAAAAEFETFETTLKTLTGSSTEAKKAMAWIEDFASKTPFSLQETTAAFVKLKSYGIDAIKGDTLKTLGDTAAAMGKDINSAVEAIADASTGEFERLKEFGIKASVEGENVRLKWADSSGKLKETVVSNNADIAQDTLKAIWNEKYHGAMDERAKTSEGIASNMQDNITKALRSIAEESGVFDGLKEGMKEVSDMLGSLTKEDIRDFSGAVKSVGGGSTHSCGGLCSFQSGWVDSYRDTSRSRRFFLSSDYPCGYDGGAASSQYRYEGKPNLFGRLSHRLCCGRL